MTASPTWEERAAKDELSKDAADRPDVYRKRVVCWVYDHLGRTIGQRDNLDSEVTTAALKPSAEPEIAQLDLALFVD